MDISCGFLITYQGTLLLGRVTNHAFFDIPKGLKEKNEDYLAGALRELYEETSLTIKNKNRIEDIGFRDYEKHKVLYLFKYEAEEQYDTLYCKSMVEYDPKRGEEGGRAYFEPFPEIDYFKWVDFTEVQEYTLPILYRAIKPYLGE
jgi:8-oxo-dGTP pyrophosphatase MutT (NUDIX family)